MLSIEECKEIGEQLQSHFKDLEFDEPSHSYSVKKVRHTSVSKMIENFVDHFDDVSGSISYADKRGLDSQDVLLAWRGENKMSTDYGHKVHDFGERYALWKYFDIGSQPRPSNLAELGITQWWHDMVDVPGILYPVALELKMYHKDYPMAGTADKLLIDRRDSKLIIADYKGLALDTPIPTTQGWKTMGTLELSDKVYDISGNITNILNISDVHYNPCYEITFDTNDKVTCDHEHKWLITVRKGGSFLDKVLTTEELFELVKSDKSQPASKKQIPRIQVCGTIDSEDIELPIDPYVLGIWLADGNKACGMITNMDKPVWDEIETRGYSLGHDTTPNDTADYRTIYGLHTQLRLLNLLRNKHIPDIYFQASYKQRLDLLRGFMDGDGYLNKKRHRCVMSTTKEWQADEFTKLIGSLGWKSSRIFSITKFNGKEYPTYDICFRAKENPFLARNKDCMDYMNVKMDHTKFRKIKSVVKVDTVTTRCIEVDSPSHTYLFGYSYIPTHNTNKDIFKKAYCNLLGHFSHFPDNPIHHYYIQFSFYQTMIERVGYEVKARVLSYLKKNEKTGKLYQNYYTPDLTKQLNEFLKNHSFN